MDKKIYEILERSLTNIAQNYADEYIDKNAEFRASAGLKEKIIRSTNGKCCKWCDKLAGIYNYPAPREVYQRHDNCDCTVTYVSEKGAQDVHTKQQLRKEEVAERIKKIEQLAKKIPANFEDIKAEYFKTAKTTNGKTKIEEGVNLRNEKKAIENAEVLSEFFGDEIIVLKDINEEKVKTPDYLWRGKFWEQKSISTATAADSATRSALNKFVGREDKAGGIIYDITNNKASIEEICRVIQSRMNRREETIPVDLIFIKDKKIAYILRYKKVNP